MSKSPTVYDVARRAGVSIATVSFTFRQPDRVRAATRDLVLAAAADLGYIPSASARGLAQGRTGALGLLSLDYRPNASPNDDRIATALDPDPGCREFPLYVDEVQRGAELECRRRGYALVVAAATPTSGDEVLTDLAGRVDGLALFSGTVPQARVEKLARRLPLVFMSSLGSHEEHHWVGVDNETGVRQIMAHLICEHGYERIAFAGAINGADRTERFETYRRAMLEAGLDPVHEPLGDYAYRIDPARCSEEVTTALQGFEAVVCTTDEIALGVMDSLNEHEVSVPDDIAVTGFDGIVAGRLSTPTLTTVRQPMVRMGVHVVSALVDQIDEPGRPPTSIELETELVVRRSCGCPDAPPSGRTSS